MPSTLSDFMYFVKINKRNDAVKIIITDECKIGCRHCAPACNSKKSLIDYKIIDEIFNQLKPSNRKWIIGIQGGEAMYYPNTIKYIIDKTKEAGYYSGLTTSGYWRHDQSLVDFIEHLGLNYLILSYDQWHNEKIPKEDTLWLRDYFKNKMHTFLQYCFVWEEGIEKSEFRYQDKVIIRPMIVFGRGKQFEWILNHKDFNEPVWTQCEYNGFAVEVDGSVHMQCTNWNEGCVFGNIFDVNLLKLRDTIGRPKIKSEYHFYKTCRKLKLETGKGYNILDPQWNNSLVSKDYFWNCEYPVDSNTCKEKCINGMTRPKNDEFVNLNKEVIGNVYYSGSESKN